MFGLHRTLQSHSSLDLNPCPLTLFKTISCQGILSRTSEMKQGFSAVRGKRTALGTGILIIRLISLRMLSSMDLETSRKIIQVSTLTIW